MRIPLPRHLHLWLLATAGILVTGGMIGVLLFPSLPAPEMPVAVLENIRAGRFRDALQGFGKPSSVDAQVDGTVVERRAFQEAWAGLLEAVGPTSEEEELRAAIELALRVLGSGADLIEPPHVLVARLRHALLIRSGASAPFQRLGDLFVEPLFERDPEMAWEAVAAAALAGRWADAAVFYLSARDGGEPPRSRADLRCWPDPRLARDALWCMRITAALGRTKPDLAADVGQGIDEVRAEIDRSVEDLIAAGDAEHRSLGLFLAGSRALAGDDPEAAFALLSRALQESGIYYEGADDPDYLPTDRAGLEICLRAARALAVQAERFEPPRRRGTLPPSIRRARLVEVAILSARAGLPGGVELMGPALERAGISDAARDLVDLLGAGLAGEAGVAARIREAIGKVPGLPGDLTADAILDGDRIRPFPDDALPAVAIRVGRLCEDLDAPEVAGTMIARLGRILGESEGELEAIRLYIEALSLGARGDLGGATALLRRLLDLQAMGGGLPRGLEMRDIAERLAALQSRREGSESARRLRDRARRNLDWIIDFASQRDGAEGLVAVAHALRWTLCEGDDCDAEEAAAAFRLISIPTEREDRAWLDLAGRLEASLAQAEAVDSSARGEAALRALRVLCHDGGGSRFLLEEARILRARALRAGRESPAARDLWSRAASSFDRHARLPANDRFAFDAGEAHFLCGEFAEAAVSFEEFLAGEGLRRTDDVNRVDGADHRLFAAQFFRALSLLRDGRPGEAIDAIEKLPADSREALGRSALYAQGMSDLGLGAPERAEASFRRIVVAEEDEQSPRWRRAQLRLGGIGLERAAALDKDPSATSDVRREAYLAARIAPLRVLQVLGDDEDRPLSTLAETLRVYEDADWRTPTGLACALQLGEVAEGLARVDPENRAAWLEEAERRFVDAAARFARIERREPSADLRPPVWMVVRALLGAADAAFEQGDAAAARTAYERARARGLDGAQELWALYRLGGCARALGLPQAARRYLEGGARLLASGAIGGAELALLPGPAADGDRARFWQERIAAGLAGLP
ncbi:MAG: tetratricopeptide repeat protein [Planctomycetes bacterium]|nr:tetratricopeptide repeat protein [Planctomycetota bacterium]